jgi:hypothetical protein
MWLLVGEFNSAVLVELSPLLWHIRPLLYGLQALAQYFGIFQLGWALTLLFLFSTLQWVATYMWLLVDEFNSRSISGTIPIWDIGYCAYRLFQLNYFESCLSARMGPNPFVPFQRSMGCNVYVTTRGWIQLQYWWNYPHFFETLEPLLYVQALPAQLFWYLSARMGPNLWFFSARSMGCNVHVTTRGSTRSIGGTIPTSLTHWSRYCTYRLFQLLFFGISQLGWALTLLFLFSTLQ